jgi:hypothetical protein
VALIFSSVLIYGKAVAKDTRIASGYVVGKRYIPRHTETIVVPTTDSDGNVSLRTETITVPDDYDLYLGNQKLQEVEKRGAAHGGEMIGIDGVTRGCNRAKYQSTYPGEVAVWLETYDNPLKRNSNTLFKKMKQNQYPVPHTPEIFEIFDMNRVTTIGNVKLDKDYHTKINIMNSLLNKYNINIGFIITTLPDTYYDYLKNQWRGGQPNDFVVLLFVDSRGALRNADVVCWGNEYLRLKIKSDIMERYVSVSDFDSIITAVYEEIRVKGFREEDFSKFEYLRATLPDVFLFILFIASIIVSVVTLEIFRTNDENDY